MPSWRGTGKPYLYLYLVLGFVFTSVIGYNFIPAFNLRHTTTVFGCVVVVLNLTYFSEHKDNIFSVFWKWWFISLAIF
jgi:hypothetical protein